MCLEAAFEHGTAMLQAPPGFMDVHRIKSIQLGTDVKVLEVLLWGRIASQPHFSWLVHAASAPAARPAHICQWAGAEGPRLEPASSRGLLPMLCTLEENAQV